MAVRDILICAYGFPPVAGPTERRCAEFVRFLADRGWTIDVLTIQVPPGYYRSDPGDTRLIPDSVRVYRTYAGPFHDLMGLNAKGVASTAARVPGARPLGLRLLKASYNALVRPLVVPDRTLPWTPFALAAARQLLARNQYGIVFSSSSPATSHVVGHFLRQWSGLPWIGDWSDPVAFNPNLDHNRWQRAANRRIEGRLLRSMDTAIVSTEETRDAYLRHYPFLSPEKLVVINYGYSQEAFQRAEPKISERFRLLYTGVFLKTIRRPYGFFDALQRLKDLPIEVVIAGNMDEEYVGYIEKQGLSEMVTFLGHRPHSEVVSLQKGASVLLLVGNVGALQLPGKVFEYIAACRPVLALRNDSHDIAAQMVLRHNRGVVVDNDPERIAEAIRSLYVLWKDNRLEREFNLEPLDQYSWPGLGQRLEDLLLSHRRRDVACAPASP